MDLEIRDKIFIVTGGARGIGQAISKALADEGAIPIILDRSSDENRQTVKIIENCGQKAFGYTFELANPNECRTAVKRIIKEHGKIDGVVNNAGVNDGVGLENGNYESFVASLHNNLIHYYLIVHHALQELKKTKGIILNITSKTAETGQGNTSAYAAANGGRNALTREWAVELLKYHIRVNAIVVSECFTPMYASWVKQFNNPQEKLATITTKIPFKNRMTKPSEIADMAVFLLSERSSHITGQLIHVDGGYVHLDRALGNV